MPSIDEPDYLWAGIILLSMGGNMIRMAGLQLADLFPSSNTTAMAFISGIITPSAAVMMFLQVCVCVCALACVPERERDISRQTNR